MLTKTAFKNVNISYSQFLPTKKHPVHCLIDPPSVSVDIEFFKRSISLHYQHIYAIQKWKNWCYRFIFFSLSLTFLCLGGMIFFKTNNPMAGIYFNHNGLFIKNFINIVCFILAMGTFTLGYKIHPEKEAIQHLFNIFDKQLEGPAKHVQIEFNAIFANLSDVGSNPSKTTWIKKAFK